MEIKNQRQTLAVENADLAGSTFRDVNLSGSTFSDANLCRATFSDIKLDGAKFRNIDLSGVDFIDCNLAGMKIDGIPVAAAIDAYRRSVPRAAEQDTTAPAAELSIRAFRESDEPAVIDLWKSVFNYSAPHNDPALAIRMKCAVDPEFLIVAIRDGKLAGTVMGGYDGHRGWIYLLAVAPEFRRRGIATKLVEFVERALVEKGCIKVNLQVLASNADVTSFYEKLGYQVEERINLGKLLK